MRVNVQLIDAESGAHLWAERFEKTLADLFDMQDEIVARLANALNAQLVIVEARRAEQAPSPDSMDLYFQGRAWYNKGPTPDNFARARGFFDCALSTDPGNVDALAWSASADGIAGILGFVNDPPAALAAAEAKSIKALSLAPDHAQSLVILGMIHIWTNRAAQGITECERGHSVRPECDSWPRGRPRPSSIRLVRSPRVPTGKTYRDELGKPGHP